MDKTRELYHWLLLNKTPGIGPVTFNGLRAAGISPRDTIEMAKAGQAIPQLSPQAIKAIRNADDNAIEQDLRWQEGTGNHIITLDDPEYPPLLLEIPDPPPLLYVHGNPWCLHNNQLAIVGSRNPSPAGEENAYAFASSLSLTGLCITSGLALGIDTASHKGALDSNNQTIAVIGTGLDRVYPARNKALAHLIAENGALVSEYPLGTRPLPGNFPRRNRIISGLSLGTLVIEAGISSGSLITARLAIDQGRDVFAIPGSIHNPLAKGCHHLIREGAKLVESANDILNELAHVLPNLNTPVKNTTSNTATDEIDKEIKSLLDLVGFDPTSTDMLIKRSGLTAETVSSMLLVLELRGMVKSSSGYYTRTNEKVSS
jgi:DNA processing protein